MLMCNRERREHSALDMRCFKVMCAWRRTLIGEMGRDVTEIWFTSDTKGPKVHIAS